MAGEELDDPTIPDRSNVYRAINPDYYVAEGNGYRVSSAAFKDKNELSVGLGYLIDEQGDDPSIVIAAASFADWGLAELKAGFVRRPDPSNPGKRLGIVRDAENQPYWHGLIRGKINHSLANKLATRATNSLIEKPKPRHTI